MLSTFVSSYTGTVTVAILQSKWCNFKKISKLKLSIMKNGLKVDRAWEGVSYGIKRFWAIGLRITSDHLPPAFAITTFATPSSTLTIRPPASTFQPSRSSSALSQLLKCCSLKWPLLAFINPSDFSLKCKNINKISFWIVLILCFNMNLKVNSWRIFNGPFSVSFSFSFVLFKQFYWMITAGRQERDQNSEHQRRR